MLLKISSNSFLPLSKLNPIHFTPTSVTQIYLPNKKKRRPRAVRMKSGKEISREWRTYSVYQIGQCEENMNVASKRLASFLSGLIYHGAVLKINYIDLRRDARFSCSSVCLYRGANKRVSNNFDPLEYCFFVAIWRKQPFATLSFTFFLVIGLSASV